MKTNKTKKILKLMLSFRCEQKNGNYTICNRKEKG